jgi:hypothetical protein
VNSITAAAQTDTSEAELNEQLQEEQKAYSPWAEDDLAVGDTYGIYPQTWYLKDMTAPIRQADLRVLFAGVRNKLIKTDCITKEHTVSLHLSNPMTVEEVLGAFYQVISGYEYSGNTGLDKQISPATYMSYAGVFTGSEGELSLTDICSVEQACVIATRLITFIYDTLDASSKGFLWVTKYNGNTVYMLGSIHMASYDIYPFSKKILDAFKASDALAVELNMLDSMSSIKSIIKYGMYTDGTTLKDHVSAETYEKTVALAEELGYPEIQIIRFKPWCIYSMFTSLATTDSADEEEASKAAGLGIDYTFTMNAILNEKPILEVEGFEFQAKVLDSFSDELEEFLLNDMIDSINMIQEGINTAGSDSLEDALTYWHEGDIEGFLNYISPEDELPEALTEEEAELKKLGEEYQDKLITQRDIGMANYIDQLLKAEGSATYFVIVGSGHYISNHSVLDLLKEKGYEISQIK